VRATTEFQRRKRIRGFPGFLISLEISAVKCQPESDKPITKRAIRFCADFLMRDNLKHAEAQTYEEQLRSLGDRTRQAIIKHLRERVRRRPIIRVCSRATDELDQC
jgi:hypothetical protein